MRRFDAALGSYQEALDRGVSRPEEIHLNRGVIYSDCLRREEAAERELKSAEFRELLDELEAEAGPIPPELEEQVTREWLAFYEEE